MAFETINGDKQALILGAGATGAGTEYAVIPQARVFQVVISNTATCKLQASIDGVNWIDLRTSTASEGFSTDEPWPLLRGNVSAWTSGTVDLWMAT